MADPYGGQYVTAGDPYVTANGESLGQYGPASVALYQQWWGADAAKVWAQQQNQALLNSGLALMTPHGVVSLDNVKFALGKAGYNGPMDAGSLASAYQLLATPAPSPPAPQQTASASAHVAGLSLSGGIGGIPRPVLYLGAALLAYELLFSGRRRLL